MKFIEFETRALHQAPKTITIDGWTLEYQAFRNEENTHKTPVLLLGGAFQNFASFRHEAQTIYGTNPVIMLDLPSQGSNQQLAPDMELEDFAELINQFLIAHNIVKVIPIGVSYGSVMASLFAAKHPARVESLLISGITCLRRKALVALLEDSLSLLQQSRMDEFATTAVTNLINHCHLDDTGLNPTYIKLLHRQIKRLNDNERKRYAQNTRRLLSFEGFVNYPTCPTLVATGEFDNFTLPFENAAFAAHCNQGKFAVIKGADHLSNFERREETTELYHRFLQGKSIEGIEGIHTFESPVAVSQLEQRLQPRLTPLRKNAVLLRTLCGEEVPVEVDNICFFGSGLSLIKHEFNLTESTRDLQLILPEADLALNVQIIGKKGKHVRCIHIHHDMKSVHVLQQYLSDIENFQAITSSYKPLQVRDAS